MSTRSVLLTMGGLALLAVLSTSDVHAGKEALLSPSRGQLPTDTATDATQCSLEEKTELGGKALKVVYADGESFGDRVARVKNWKQFITLEFDALNPGKQNVGLTLTVKHQRSTSYQTRVDVPVVLKPGKSSVRIGVDEMVNVNGSVPDLANVVRWYLACDPGQTPTLYFGDIWLVGGDAPAPAPAAASAAAPGGAAAYRVTGKIGDMPVDLTVTPIGGAVAPGALAPQAAAAGAKPRATALLHVSGGQLPNDTGGDGGTTFSLEPKAELGGQAMKVVYADGDSFGGNPPTVKDWRRYLTLEFDVFHPGPKNVTLTLTLKHQRTTSFQTRVDVPFVLKPGKNAVKFNLDELTNVNGSAPDLARVNHWYVACQPGEKPTLYFGDFWLLDAGAARPAPGEKAAAPAPAKIKTDPARLARIRAAKMPKITKPIQFHTPEADAVLSALEVFPPDNPWNQLVDEWPRHPDSDAIIASIGADKPLRYNPDMGFVLVPPDQKRVEVKLTGYPGESDRGPYPVPENIPIEGWPGYFDQFQSGKVPSLDQVQRGTGGDRHGIVVDPASRMLYEFFVLRRTDGGWEAAQASIFDLKTNKLRPEGWTSADAAGLPIFPATVRYDELKRGIVEHAMRVTIRKTRREYVAPATHFASPHTNPEYPRMGERIRLKADFDVSGFSPPVRTILQAVKRYGMLVADNGIEWAISVAPDPRIPNMHEEFRKVRGSAFEVVVPPQ